MKIEKYYDKSFEEIEKEIKQAAGIADKLDKFKTRFKKYGVIWNQLNYASRKCQSKVYILANFQKALYPEEYWEKIEQENKKYEIEDLQ